MNHNRKLPSRFIIDQQECSDTYRIANHFCRHVNVGHNLSKSIQNVSVSYTSFLTGNYVNSIFLRPSSEQGTIDTVGSFRNSVGSMLLPRGRL